MSSPPDPLPLEPPWVQGGGVHAKRIQAPFLTHSGEAFGQVSATTEGGGRN